MLYESTNEFAYALISFDNETSFEAYRAGSRNNNADAIRSPLPNVNRLYSPKNERSRIRLRLNT